MGCGDVVVGLSFVMAAAGGHGGRLVLGGCSQVSRVLRLLSCKDRYLQLAAIRFLRSCVGIKDEFYNRCVPE